jgi:hypothetical protein
MNDNSDEIDPKIQNILTAYPVRVPVTWHKEKGIVVIIYPKSLNRFEKKLQKHIGGPENVRRTLDERGSIIWELCDGRNNIKDICDVLDTRYHEEIEPVLEYVHNALLVLLERNLIKLEQEKPEKPLPVRKQRVLKKDGE